MSFNVFDSNSELKLALPDGELICFRPIKSSDRPMLQQGMSLLSKQSRLFRFFSPISKLSNNQLNYFTEVDQDKHVAWIALTDNQTSQTGLGIARFIQSSQQPNIADFALVVIDHYQKRGLGTILMALLYAMALKKNIGILRASILLENTVMRSWLSRLGASGEFIDENYYMNLTVSTDLSPFTSSSWPQLKHHIKCIDEYLVTLKNNSLP